MSDSKTKKRESCVGIKFLFFDFVKYTSAIPMLLFLRPKNIYESEAAKKKIWGGAMLVANHTGFVDPLALMASIWYRRHHYVALKDFFRNGFMKLLFKGFMCIEIDRENMSMNTMRKITDELEKGSLVGMFPEGHINQEQQNGMQQFKSGMVLMAARAGVPIVPCYIVKRKSIWNRQRVVIGEPVETRIEGKMPSMSQIEEITNTLYERIKALGSLCTVTQ